MRKSPYWGLLNPEQLKLRWTLATLRAAVKKLSRPKCAYGYYLTDRGMLPLLL